MARVAIYARVSKDDGSQDAANQVDQLRAWCAATGHEIAHEYVDQISGSKGADKREHFARLFDDAHKRRFDIVLCWALDRFSREGMVPTIMHLQRLATAGVGFHSYTEPLLSTDNEMVRDIVLAVMAAMAKQERVRLIERTKAGMRRARSQGKVIGRPRVGHGVEAAVRAALANGASLRAAASAAGCSVGKAHAISASM